MVEVEARGLLKGMGGRTGTGRAESGERRTLGRMLARDMPKMANSEDEEGGVRTSDCDALLPWRLEEVAVGLPCGGVGRWDWEKVGDSGKGEDCNDGVPET